MWAMTLDFAPGSKDPINPRLALERKRRVAQ